MGIPKVCKQGTCGRFWWHFPPSKGSWKARTCLSCNIVATPMQPTIGWRWLVIGFVFMSPCLMTTGYYIKSGWLVLLMIVILLVSFSNGEVGGLWKPWQTRQALHQNRFTNIGFHIPWLSDPQNQFTINSIETANLHCFKRLGWATWAGLMRVRGLFLQSAFTAAMRVLSRSAWRQEQPAGFIRKGSPKPQW